MPETPQTESPKSSLVLWALFLIALGVFLAVVTLASGTALLGTLSIVTTLSGIGLAILSLREDR